MNLEYFQSENFQSLLKLTFPLLLPSDLLYGPANTTLSGGREGIPRRPRTLLFLSPLTYTGKKNPRSHGVVPVFQLLNILFVPKLAGQGGFRRLELGFPSAAKEIHWLILRKEQAQMRYNLVWFVKFIQLLKTLLDLLFKYYGKCGL